MSDKPPLDPLEVIDESLPASPEDATLRALSTLKVTQLKNRLSDAGVNFHSAILKPELQSLWAFHTLQILTSENNHQTQSFSRRLFAGAELLSRSCSSMSKKLDWGSVRTSGIILKL